MFDLGEVDVEAENLDRFFSTARDLEIKGIINNEHYTLKRPQTIPKLRLKAFSKLKFKEPHPELTPIATKAEMELAVDEIPDISDDPNISEFIKDRTKLIEAKGSHPLSGHSSRIDPEDYFCGQCDSSFANKATLQYHINKQHLKIKFSCETCNDYETHIAAALKKHKMNAHGELDAMLKCPKCDYKSSKTSKLREHILNIHEGARYPCVQCSYVARSFGNLQSHRRSQHEGIRYACDQCDHKSTRKQYLMKHKEKVHKL